MKFLKVSLSPNQTKALLRKDFLVRWRQKWLTAVQVLWPCVIFLLPYLIRLKFEPVHRDACQFPTRQLPTARNTMAGFLSYICSIENKCISTENYEEYTKLEKSPMKPIIDIVQIFINEDRMFTALVELPEKANFISAVTVLATDSHFEEIRKNVEKVVALVPDMEKVLNGSFDIKRLFSDRKTFVKAGNLLCGHPFPNTETIPLVEDILYSEDFSHANQDELNVMPTKYCKRLYLDVTSSNYGKITWDTIKPIIQGKILYGPETDDTNSIIKFSNATFIELNRLKMISNALEQILTKLREDKPFQDGFDNLIRLVQTPFVRSIIGDEIDLDQIEAVIQRIRTDPIIYDVVTTIKNILECVSVNRFEVYNTENELRRKAFELNQKRLFYAAVYFNETEEENIAYKFHMDTQNTQPTIENKNRFWFPGPAGSMLMDLKYHRGFVQIKQAIDLGIIKHKKEKLKKMGLITEPASTTPRSSISVQLFGDENDEDEEEDDEDDWFTDIKETENSNSSTSTLISHFMSDDLPSFHPSQVSQNENVKEDFATTTEDILENFTTLSPQEDDKASTIYPYLDDNLEKDALNVDVLKRQKRQNFVDLLLGFADDSEDSIKFAVDELQFFTKQFPYPAYTEDNFKTGIYLAQAIQCAFLLGLVTEIASCVRHLIWMRESKNLMIMRSMGLKPCSEISSWCIVTFLELLFIFIILSIILYGGGIVVYTTWFFTMIYICIFGACLISFCYLCSTFFVSAIIGALATTVIFFISFCPYIIVLLFDAKLNSLQNFIINLSFTTAFAHGWSHIMRMELQEIGLNFETVFREGLTGEFGFSLFMIVLDLCLYSLLAYIHLRFKADESRFVEVQREDLDPSVGATLTNVTKTYNEHKIAVSDISLSFPRNQVTCLLGRNGAGKSTIIKMLTGQIVQTTGRVILSQAMSNSKEYEQIGVCSQDNILIPNLTAREHLEIYAKIKLKHGCEAEVNKTLKDLNFGKYENYLASQLSGGYQRRLCVAIAFIGSPNVVILDEPCNGVDSKARKGIWELIERLRKRKAVIFATHFLDEAEHLSDVIVIMKNGKIIAKHNPESLKNHCTSYYEVTMNCCDSQTSDEVLKKAEKLLTNFREMEKFFTTDLRFKISYDQQNENSIDFLKYLEDLQIQGRIKDLSLETENLEHEFKNLDQNDIQGSAKHNSYATDNMKTIKLKKKYGCDVVRETPLTRCEAIRLLFWKRLVHFSRNYRILLCVILFPALFEILAMWFVTQRLEDDFDKTIKLSRDLYPKTTQMLSMEKTLNFTQEVYGNMKQDCSREMPCKIFNNSEKSFYWILETLNDYHGKRYGGYSFNDTKSIVWYNNKGYHAMMAWLNDMNSYLLQSEINNSNYKITAYNEPWELGFMELSTTSIVRQTGDSCLAFILLIAFSLVVAVSSVYLVNERVKGEKLQQKLCGVDVATYWGVAFVWDFLIMILAILVCASVILAFDMPVFNDRQQLWGVLVLALFFAFACIPAVHVFEKCFLDSSIAIVTIFLLNVIIPLFTMSLIIVLGVVGDSVTWDKWRHFLNHRLFLIFPQHALGDGLLEICKNYMVAVVFKRYDIDSYKNPVTSDLLLPHYISLTALGIFFLFINASLESGLYYRCKERIMDCLGIYHARERKHIEELKIVSIQNSLKRIDKCENKAALTVENLSKTYGKNQYAVSNVTFAVKVGECFGLLGKNGAGKSTMFKMLSGQFQPTAGHIFYENPEISYCPQTNTLDSLLTVQECIEFYGRLRRITNINKLVASILESYQLESYRNVLVKNLSGGNRRKLTVATTCCGRTSVVLLDEPTSDMDPVTRAIVYRTIDELLAEKRAIILTSHSIAEIDEICHRIAILKEGQMLTCSSPENLKAQYGGFYNVTVYCDQYKINELETEIRRKFVDCKELQIYAHSIKFSVKVDSTIRSNAVKENGTYISEELHQKNELIKTPLTTISTPHNLTLSELFHELYELSQQLSFTIRYAINKCKLDAVFERILDKSEKKIKTNGCWEQSPAVEGTASTGYIHNGYIESETVT